MPSPTFNLNRDANTSLRCDAPACYMPRVGVDRFCNGHRKRGKALGHPDARPVRATAWRPFAMQVRALFKANEGHPGLHAAEEFIAGLLQRASANSPSLNAPSREELQRLVTAGISPREVLVAALGAMLLLDWNPRAAAVDCDTARDFAIARAVLGLTPQRPAWSWSTEKRGRPYRRPYRLGAMRYLGPYLRRSLAEFFAVVKVGAEAQSRASKMTNEEKRAARTTPLRVTF